ncbi:right-handed parallel beta-helix repeat-containing protein [Parashewanella spongiae]|uniref:Right-handed parallel beta-helix repeat-containing protein n=1 Tax=Parashewanella spongiae TaxID=342950 RepID=A0A3A6TKW2_9GAMM|nr:right-handed parallel beta-helix repeat-containing protein [Parashewanella spongiae]MCL1079026.1 right-handed parallel beta-helix repeat-containing protein [Parashewanella spongiae]RJY10959.1 right-handed parallel beta-helix repeat-containing protein [Parashewanella spongiae]
MKYLLLILSVLAGLSRAETVEMLPPQPLAQSIMAPSLPDISMYNLQWVKNKRPKLDSPPTIALEKIYDINAFQEFSKGIRAIEWVKRQTTYPQAIVIKYGVATLDDLVKQVDGKYFQRLADGVYISRLPIIISSKATLIISKDTNADKLLLSQTKGAFILNAGNVFFIETQIIGWDEHRNAPAFFKHKKSFRPFITGQGLSNTHLVASTFKHLGYFQSKSYGVLLTSVPKKHSDAVHDNPNGWFIDNFFEDIYYGFYSYEAEDTVIVGNTYFDNIVYGIDPHDYSKRLVIANNTTHKTRQLHGIIVSRGVEDSWIFNNKSFDNNGNGVVLDRQSKNNVIAYNHSYNNKGDGITLFESPDALIYGNVIHNNGKHGIRIRNSQHVTSAKNIIKGNGQLGVYIYTADPNGKERGLVLDPYVKKASYASIHDQFIHNKSGALGSDKLYPLVVSGAFLRVSSDKSGAMFTGGYAPFNQKILKAIEKDNKAVAFVKKGE